ncbi:type II toxin-antitoxin system death-on-curing family toxin [Patescibacteria group bacterium]|nr:type II toxin-antitoxin system death-on-curing family toxin [Patescibacteria group bacterium]
MATSKDNKSIVNRGEVIIYQPTGKISSLEVRLNKDTVWLTLQQMADLFNRDKSVISRHLTNIYKEKELNKSATVAKYATVQNEGNRQIKRALEYYNLDAIISVGYRVNSKQGTRFRVWASKVLKDHLVQGFTLNQNRLKDQTGLSFKKLEQAVSVLQNTLLNRYLDREEAIGLLQVITDYTQSWLLLHSYDQGVLPALAKELQNIKYRLSYDQAVPAISELKNQLVDKKQASDLFGLDKSNSLVGILAAVNQTYAGRELYFSLEDKAAHLFYLIIKDHPFVDGNKRIASFLLIIYLARNNYLLNKKGQRKIADTTLVALALLVASSQPKQKDIMIQLVKHFISVE